ncbi:hypothetical protein DFH06DRAFT_1303404 [Mycena polygramma]|nr:hypothetical protein DFH06DRAFT_1303404 [Mycena polygramma]
MSVVCVNCGYRSVPDFAPAHETSRGDYSPTPTQLRTELEEVNLAILRQKAFLDALEKRRRDLETGLSKVVYPVLTLPPEILSGIFVECVPTQEPRARPSPVTPPLSLAQVCHYWRGIALSTCELWSCVNLFLGGLGGDGELEKFANDKALALLETWFARAKGRLLSVKIRSRTTRVPKAVLYLVAAASGRLHTLDLDLYPEDFVFFGGNCGLSSFPSLRRLSVSSPWVYDPLPIFGNTQSLSELRADKMSSISHMYPLLTSLELGEISTEKLVDIVTHCPSLSHLKVVVTEPDDIPDAEISAPHLRSLSLHGYGLDFLTLPGLRRLEVWDDLCDLEEFLGRSSCVLEHLTLHVAETAPDCLTYFQAMPALTFLSIEIDQDVAAFAEVFDEDPAVLPHLTTLVVSASVIEDFDYLELAYGTGPEASNDLSSRWRSPCLAGGEYRLERITTPACPEVFFRHILDTNRVSGRNLRGQNGYEWEIRVN